MTSPENTTGLTDTEVDTLLERWDQTEEPVKRFTVAALTVRAGRLLEALTPSAETKAEYSGEFKFEHGPDAVTVPWTTIKEVMAAILRRASR